MFQWDKSITTLELPAAKTIHLFRSMRDVQLALPGLPAQEASAYLCQYEAPQGVGTAVVFHLHKSSQLAFYVEAPSVVPAGKAETMLDRALVFVESMGFLMTDLDIHLLGESDREMLWSSLPLQKGITVPERVAGPKALPASTETVALEPPQPAKKQVKQEFVENLQVPVHLTAESEFLKGDIPAGESPRPVAARAEPAVETDAVAETEGQGNVDELLAAVEALRTRRPGVRARKKAPSSDELRRRRHELRENIGHILASQ